MLDEFAEAIILEGGEGLRESLEIAVRGARWATRLSRFIDAELADRRAHARAAFDASYRGRFGPIPTWLDEKLGVLDRSTLVLARALVETSADTRSFVARWKLLEAACVEQRLAGARGVLAEFLRRRYGHPISYTYEDLLSLVSVDELNGCFNRLDAASSLEDVLEPVLSRLGSQAGLPPKP